MPGPRQARLGGDRWRATLVALLVSATARAAPPVRAPAEAESEAPRSYPVEFRAGRVEFEGDSERLELTRDVVVTVDRYRLTSDHLSVTKGPRGVVVDGGGRLSLCRCDSAPVQIGFDSALVAPPTDLLVEDPTLRVAGVPVCWLPYFWLRSPSRLGLLPPTVAYRGEDGLLLGAGVHFPLGGSGSELSSIDVTAGGYLEGGVDLGVRAVTPESSTMLRWDHLGESLVAVDTHGSLVSKKSANLAWDVDAVRGARGRRGLISLEEAARRYDRLRVSVSHVAERAVVGLGMRADTPRGGSYDEIEAYGPEAQLGAFTALGEVGSGDLAARARTSVLPDGEVAMLLNQGAALELSGRPGVFGVSAELRQKSELLTEQSRAAASTSLGARLAATLPLARSFGGGSDPVEHWVEPEAELAAASIATAEGPLVANVPEGEVLTLLGGVHTSLGRRGARWAIEVDGRGGALVTDGGTNPAAFGRMAATTGPLGASVMAGFARDPRDSHVTTSRVRLGPSDGVNLSGYAQGRSAAEPLEVRAVAFEAWDAPRAGWFDAEGWTTGGELGVPWTRWLASRFGGDYDVTSETLLGVRGALAYRHPCGCLAVIGWAGHRLGRDGVDASLTVDLLP